LTVEDLEDGGVGAGEGGDHVLAKHDLRAGVAGEVSQSGSGNLEGGGGAVCGGNVDQADVGEGGGAVVCHLGESRGRCERARFDVDDERVDGPSETLPRDGQDGRGDVTGGERTGGERQDDAVVVEGVRALASRLTDGGAESIYWQLSGKAVLGSDGSEHIPTTSSSGSGGG